ncbi:MAG TPA: hypothetical protein VLD62_10260, partial [Acidimicrobiia bacterium]|nr:hypothetical protein [Acidimicrobiia bacterium]
RRDNERGAAMVTVVLGTAALAFLVILMFQQAANEFAASQTQRRDDTLVAGAEAMLERYAAKLTIDPVYYLNRVDEAEMPRRCTKTSSAHHGVRAEPGSPWYSDCGTWDYEEPEGYFDHPLLDGEAGLEGDDIGTLMAISPPSGLTPLQITVVTTHDNFGHSRSITAEITPEAISEYAFLVDESLRFGPGARIDGKIYAGRDLDFYVRGGSNQDIGVVTRDIYAEGAIGTYSGSYGPPLFLEGAQGYDSTGTYGDIRIAHPEPLDFNDFWDDIETLRNIACGSGLCLDGDLVGLQGDPTAWLIEPVVVGDVGRLRVSAAYSTNSKGCVTTEEWWWLHSAEEDWRHVGTFDIPDSGAVWADEHVIMGKGTPGTTKGVVTIGAGSAGAPKNIVIGGDLLYAGGTTGTDVLGLAASDEVWVSPSAVGPDNELTIHAAILAQGGSFQVARNCGENGDVLLPRTGSVPDATLNTFGSMAILHTGDVAAHFSPRNYTFDPRLEKIRPPLFPLLGDGWVYENWRETTLPCWARSSGC